MEDWESKDNIQEAILRTEDQRQMYEFGKEASMILFIITMIFSFIFSSELLFMLTVGSMLFFWWSSGKEFVQIEVIDCFLSILGGGEE